VDPDDAPASMTIPPLAREVGKVRRFVRDHLSDRAGVDRDTVDMAELLVGELVTNAVVHSRTDVSVRVHQYNVRLRIEVYDENPRMPQPCLTPLEATSGRGLGLVDAFSSAWGVQRLADGKVVWFEITTKGRHRA
jgi:anti-sigma regulatory factor (Ser/Thr protein kinase)